MEKKINSFATTNYRRILGTNRLIETKKADGTTKMTYPNNLETLEKVNQKELYEEIIKRQVEFVNNIINSVDNPITKKYLYEPKMGKTKRGCAPKLYKDRIIDYL